MTPEQFRAHLALKGLSDHTIRTYSSFYSRWWGHPSSCPSADWQDEVMWTPLGVREWSRTLPQTRSSLEQARNAVTHACLAQGVDPELKYAIRIPAAARKKRSRALTPDEAHQLHEQALGAGLKGLAVIVGLYTAARRSEIACLAWEQVDFTANEITLVRPKNHDTHTLPMHPILRRELRLHQVVGAPWVFPGQWGGHLAPSTIATWVTQVADAAGVARMTSHRLRHTALTEINDRTRDLRAAQEVAGHVDPSVTAKYTRAGAERVTAAIRSLDYGTAA